MSGLLPSIIFPSDIEALQAQLLGALKGTDQSVQTCTSLSQADRASWGQFYLSAYSYTQTPIHWYSNATGTLYNQGQSYLAQLYAWQKSLNQSCALSVPLIDLSASQTPPAVTVIKTLAIVAGAGALGYGLYEGYKFVDRKVGHHVRRIRASF